MSRASRTFSIAPLAGRLTTTAFDQAFASLRNSMLLLSIAASAGVAVFGAFAVAYAVVSFALAVVRSYVGIPLTIDLPGAGPQSARLTIGQAMALALFAGVPVLAVLVAAGVFDPRHLGMLLALGVVSPVLLVQDVLRYAASATARPGAALLADVCWLGVASSALVLGIVRELHPGALVLLWGAGGVVAFVVGWSLIGCPIPRMTQLRRVLAEDRRRARLGAEAAISASTSLVTVNGIAAFAGRDVVGQVRAATTLFGGLMSVVLTFLSFGLGPELAKMRPRTRMVAAAAAAVGTAVFVVAWGVLVMTNPLDLSAKLLGASWEGARPLIPYLIVEGVGLCAWVAFGTLLRVSGRTLVTLRISAAYATCSVATILSAAAVAETPGAIVRAMAVLGLAVGTVAAVTAVRVTVREQRQ